MKQKIRSAVTCTAEVVSFLKYWIRFRTGLMTLLLIIGLLPHQTAAADPDGERPVNIIFILSDDHRYDMMGFHENAPEWLETPSMDRMAREGVHLQNAFVTTSLCSPSRASILTGQYAHNHKVIDNQSPIPEGTSFFNEDLHANGYRTGFFGKWHMGNVSDDPMPGWDRWVSFRGQGPYYDPVLNVDGDRIPHQGYTTDLLTEHALSWLDEMKGESEPFFLYLSHKAVHALFEPAPRHKGKFSDVEIPYPQSMDNTERNYRTKPRWVKDQRYSWHGVDYPYHGNLDFEQFYRQYNETLLALDESIGAILDYLEASGLDENTLVIYMGDNGFLLGEHGLIDKRNAYEESIRVPMLAWSPNWLESGSTIDALIRNIDVAPTILQITGASSKIPMDGASFVDILTGESEGEARDFFYEYYWESAFPQTPTTLALRTDKYKYIFYQGVWDRDELYDLEADPSEHYNLSEVPHFRQVRNQMRNQLFEIMEERGAMQVPLRRSSNRQNDRLIGN